MEAKKLFEIYIGDLSQERRGTQEGDIRGIALDSRKVVEGGCYIAIRGNAADGHDFIPQAIAAGAKAIVCETMPDTSAEGVFYLRVSDTRAAAARLAHGFYGDPSAQTTVVGVTGTNGKTTVATLLYQLYTRLGFTCGLISTVENIIGQEVIPATHTTPDAVSLAALMRDMKDKGCDYIFMEVSSHALDQKRVMGVHFKAAVFTNITHDHLDYHKTFLAYIQAKKLFFDHLEEGSLAIINMDDRNGKTMVQNTRGKVVGYALHTMADYRCKILADDITGLQLRINQWDVSCRISGAFNAYNLTAVLAVAHGLGQDHDEVLSILSGLRGAEGRMEKVDDAVRNRTGIVDYAHTPDALENVLKTITASAGKDQKIITVVGCGGDRDAAKRPIMAALAAKYSHTAIFTSDNPRSEDPESILDQMMVGLDEEQKSRSLRITDRLMAIKTAAMMAGNGDIVLVAGKGHEKYQDIKGVKYPFEDKKILSEAFSGHI